jgi:hypothetical protein
VLLFPKLEFVTRSSTQFLQDYGKADDYSEEDCRDIRENVIAFYFEISINVLCLALFTWLM